MAEIDEAFNKLTNQNKTFGNIEYFFTQRKINEDHEYLDKTLTRKNKQVNVVYNFLAINIPNIMTDNVISGFDIEIFGDIGYHYKAFISSYQGITPHFLIPLKGDKKIFINILPKFESKNNTNTNINNITQNYIAFIDVPKRYHNNETQPNQLSIEGNENDTEE